MTAQGRKTPDAYANALNGCQTKTNYRIERPGCGPCLHGPTRAEEKTAD